MKHGTRTMLMAAALMALQAGCQKAETPTDTGADMAGTEAPAQAPDPEALAQADRDYQVALERCAMLAASEQAACGQEAQSRLEAARQAAQDMAGPS